MKACGLDDPQNEISEIHKQWHSGMIQQIAQYRAQEFHYTGEVQRVAARLNRMAKAVEYTEIEYLALRTELD